MVEFDEHFEVARKVLLTIGLDFNTEQPVTKREKMKKKLTKFCFWGNLVNIALGTIAAASFAFMNSGELAMSGPAFANLFLFFIITIKTIHLVINWHNVMDLKQKLKLIYEAAQDYHSHRYERNLRISNIMFKTYFVTIYLASLLFLAMPIMQNIINLINGSDHWERILAHQAYFPFDYEPLPIYFCVSMWMVLISLTSNNYMVANEIFFDSLLVNLSMEFDNLSEKFEDFDYKNGDFEEFKRLVDRHNEVLSIASDMNSIYSLPIFVSFLGSSMLICFSLLQFFMQDFLVQNFFNLMKFGAYLSASCLQMFMLSYFCEKLKTSSGNVAVKIFRSNWYESGDIKVMKNVQMVLIKGNNPVQLTAMDFFGIDLECFTNVMSTAYSYFSFLKSYL